MTSFGLTKNTMLRLQARFQEFQHARQTVRSNLKSYISDYMNFTGKSSDRNAALEEKYMPRSPQMGWLIFSEGKNILWQENDIAVLMGRTQPSISRVLSRMQHSPGWCSRLLALSEEAKSANNVTITAYHDGIFDLIFDKYEDEYLHRFIRPRRGSNPPDASEVMRFWQYLKDSEQDSTSEPEFSEGLSIVSEQPEIFPDLPKLGTKDIFSLIWSKILTRKTGIIFTFLFIMSYELARRWQGIIPVIFAASLVTLMVCVIFLHIRKYRAGLLSDIGAVSALTALLLGMSLLSDGKIYTLNGNAIALNTGRKINLEPKLAKGNRVIFLVNSDGYSDLKDILYKTDAEQEYISNGLNDYGFPDLTIEPEIQEGIIHIDVKYTDKDNKQHGPYKFTYDISKLRFDLSKKVIAGNNWLYISRIAGNASVYVHISNYAADNAAESVVYGVNGEPDTVKKLQPGTNKLITLKNSRIDYVKAYLVFLDGTSSDIKTAK